VTQKHFRPLPSADETLLLRAACLPAAAAAAWQEWRARNQIEACSKTESDLFPAIFRNLEASGALGKDAPIFKGNYRRSWVQNQVTLDKAAAVIRRLQDAQIDTIILKGGALVVDYYHDIGVRPMADVDVLVRVDKVAQALDVVRDDGWQLPAPFGGDLDHVIQVVRSLDFVKPGAGGFDLHWHVLIDCCDRRDDDDFWSASQPLNLNGIETRSLCAADLFLNVVVHGFLWTNIRNLRWPMDAYTVLKEAGDSFDWTRLCLQARQRGLVLPVLAGLRYLQDSLEVDVPKAALSSLERAPVSRLDRLDFRAQDGELSLPQWIYRDAIGYLKRTRRRPIADRLRGSVWYMQAVLGKDNPWALIPKVFMALGRRLVGARPKPPPQPQVNPAGHQSIPPSQ
jgi:hypothetical protein